MRFVFPIFVVLSLFVGLFFLGKYATKHNKIPTEHVVCVNLCGNGACDVGYVCTGKPCICQEDLVSCPQDCVNR